MGGLFAGCSSLSRIDASITMRKATESGQYDSEDNYTTSDAAKGNKHLDKSTDCYTRGSSVIFDIQASLSQMNAQSSMSSEITMF